MILFDKGKWLFFKNLSRVYASNIKLTFSIRLDIFKREIGGIGSRAWHLSSPLFRMNSGSATLGLAHDHVQPYLKDALRNPTQVSDRPEWYISSPRDLVVVNQVFTQLRL